MFPAYADTTVGVRSKQLAEALEDPEARHDLAYALLMTSTEERTNDPEEASKDDPELVTETQADPEEEVSAPNTARRQAAIYAARTARVLSRS